MLRPVRFPVAALFAAVLFLVAGAERAFSYAACPHHGVPAHTGDRGHAEHAGGAPADHQGPCSCLGACQAAQAGFLPARPAPHVAAAGSVIHAAGTSAEGAELPGLAPHTLPFATAPPAPPEDR